MRPIHSLLLFLIFLVPATLQEKHWFQFDGEIFCKLQKTFCFHIVFSETDRFSADDFIGEQRGCTTIPLSSYKYNVTGYQEGDGWLNNDYEIGRVVYHNCTVTGKPGELRTPYFLTQGLSGTKLTMNIVIE